MKSKLILEVVQNNGYKSTTETNPNSPLAVLYNLLESDAVFLELLIEWLGDSETKKMKTNFILYEKNKDKIIISYQKAMFKNNNLPELHLKKESFKFLLEEWIKIRKKLPQKILIVLDEEKEFLKISY